MPTHGIRLFYFGHVREPPKSSVFSGGHDRDTVAPTAKLNPTRLLSPRTEFLASDHRLLEDNRTRFVIHTNAAVGNPSAYACPGSYLARIEARHTTSIWVPQTHWKAEMRLRSRIRFQKVLRFLYDLSVTRFNQGKIRILGQRVDDKEVRHHIKTKKESYLRLTATRAPDYE